MTKSLFATAFLLGATAILWMGQAFVGSDALALSVTVVIGCVYTIGFIELLQFHRETSTLSHALSSLAKDSTKTMTSLEPWLSTLHPAIQNSVRLRIEGERVGLPAPILSPYLIGLLVMLGLLGTFVGMVDTLKGAVIALEGTTELEAIRAGLAAPIKGLGLAFGTSVAGVAASAMLGMMATLARRDRMLETRQLDTKIASVFRSFSLTHNRLEMFKAFQIQAQALPQVAEKLELMTTKLEQMNSGLGGTLISNQQSFHDSINNMYSELATSVGNSLQHSLTESGRLAGESIQPVIEQAMSTLCEQAEKTHQQLTLLSQTQLETLTDRFTNTSNDIAHAWDKGLAAHKHANSELTQDMAGSLQAFSTQFEQAACALTNTFNESSSAWIKQHTDEDSARLQHWANAFEQTQAAATKQQIETAEQLTNQLKTITDAQQSAMNHVTQQWQQAGEQLHRQQTDTTSAIQQAAKDMSNDTSITSTHLITEISTLLASSEKLVQSRIDTEQSWVNGHNQRINDLTSALTTELTALTAAEERRGEAAITRLADLETTVTQHLATLGKELEEPMTRLIQTASETPKAAAEVISHLRQEISNNMERDNTLLEERRQIMDQLNTASSSLAQTSIDQQEAIELLVDTSGTMLKEMSTAFNHQVETEISKMSEVADHFAGSATEMSSLGEAFSLAIHLFNESNGNLIENLSRIEQAMDKSTSRSDEQMGYYVAQAREIIDHSMLSQKEIFDELRQLAQPSDNPVAAEVE